jgi:endonuclease/exonuclease/phosphatase family metal-dependent hydrolase
MAQDVVERLISVEGCSLVALTEVRREPILNWVPAAVRGHWDVVAEAKQAADFDGAILYDMERLVVQDHAFRRTRRGGSEIRVGIFVDFFTVVEADRLVVTLSHWRTDNRDSREGRALRAAAATDLRAGIAEFADDAPLVVLGDLNLEPFEEELNGLPTSRSRDTVREYRPTRSSDVLLYNASWRFLGERAPWSADAAAPTLAGTYRLTGSSGPTAWRTFDHVIVSQGLLGSTRWVLNEEMLRIFADDVVYDSSAGTPREPFDHIPLIGALDWLI